MKIDLAMQSTFGIIITCHRGDLFFTKGLLASIKMFIPTVPICIIKDGDFSIENLLSVYNITSVIEKKDVKDSILREKCFGTRCSNLVAFLESPFDYFLYLDSDLILWGNILDNLNLSDYDFIHNEPHEPYTEKVYKEQYFDYEKVFKYTEEFRWRECNFFNSGVFVSKRNIFPKEELYDIIKLWSNHRDLLPTDPQSILNILIFRNKQKGLIKVNERHLQTVAPVCSKDYLQSIFKTEKNSPKIIRPTILHWAGPKPYSFIKKNLYSGPMIFFRIQHLKYSKSKLKYFPFPFLLFEEVESIIFKNFKKVKRRFKNSKIFFMYFMLSILDFVIVALNINSNS